MIKITALSLNFTNYSLQNLSYIKIIPQLYTVTVSMVLSSLSVHNSQKSERIYICTCVTHSRILAFITTYMSAIRLILGVVAFYILRPAFLIIFRSPESPYFYILTMLGSQVNSSRCYENNRPNIQCIATHAYKRKVAEAKGMFICLPFLHHSESLTMVSSKRTL